MVVADLVDHYLVLLRDLAWRALAGAEESSSLKKRFGALLQERYPEELQLPHAYLVLLSHLLGLSPLPITPHQMPSGSTILDIQGIGEGDQIPQLTQIAELGSLWMILGSLLKNEALIHAGLKIAVWQIHTLDHQGMPHLSLWARGAFFNGRQQARWNELLFSLAYKLTKERSFAQIAHLYHQELDSTALPSQLLMLVCEKQGAPIRLLHRPLFEEVTVGLLKFTTPTWSMACSLSGFNSGMFSYHKKRVAIVNTGPQKLPLDDLDSFGVDRACSLKTRRFYETLWEKTAHHFRLKGWTKLHAAPVWMETDYHFQAQKMTLTSFFQEDQPLNSLFMTFYCRCEKMTIGGKLAVQRGSLERYQGKSLPVELSSAEETIFIEPSADLEMDVIPLAGGDHFWGANFLVAFQIDKNLLRFSIQ